MSSAGIYEDIALIRIMDLFSRTNQFLLHSNYGLAEESLKSAKKELENLLKIGTGSKKEYVNNIIKHVDNAIGYLPAKPALASVEFEFAWELGISGLPQPAHLQSEVTRTPTPTLTAYPPITLTPTPP
jgi:hypothetical protein